MMYVYDVTGRKDNNLLFTMILYNKQMRDKWLKEIGKKKKVINVIPRDFEKVSEEVNEKEF